ncbi:MAG TPA: hypothetical protein VM285_08605 [Polyangia bacterium]|nr:hypothetical protein [Polyangia bacterium]HUW17663.1 hypothetical protein [Actinomycetes bacterium]
MGYGRTTLNGIQPAAADPNRFVEVQDMKNAAYTLTATLAQPEANTARLLTLTHVQVGGVTDTLGVVTVVGKNLAGQAITEVITPSDGALVTGSTWFASVVSATGSGWTRDGAGGTEDTIVIGCAANAIIAEGAGTLHGIQINTTAAGAITVSDSSGTIAILPASVAVGTFYEWDANWSGWLRVVMAAASNVTVLHSGSKTT